MSLPVLGHLGSYEDLISQFLEAGYQSIFFSELSKSHSQLILRHDVDFDCRAALELSKVENRLGVKAVYFFLLTSDSYNLLSPGNRDAVLAIQSAGHQIGLHFDPTIYSDLEGGLRSECAILEKTFANATDIISIHRPHKSFFEDARTFAEKAHTYLPKYFKEISYQSDSQGAFRFGHPLESEAFKERRTIHLLTHPIWWVRGGRSELDSLDRFLEDHKRNYQEHIGRNCLPYQKHLVQSSS